MKSKLTLEAAKKKIKSLEKNPKYHSCYFWYEKQENGSYKIFYSDPGEGVGW